MPDLFDRLNTLYRRKENFINSKLSGMEKSVAGMADTLLSQLISDYLGKFQTEGGKILSNTYNVTLVNNLEKQFNKFAGKVSNINTQYGKDMLKTSVFSQDYYAAFPDISKDIVNNLTKGLGNIEAMIGLKGDTVIAGSFLDSLNKMPEVQDQLKKFVLQNVAGNNSYSSFLTGITDLVKGKPGAEGMVQKYYRQYAYDTFNNVDAAINLQFAKSVGFKYFIYQGSIITDSRAFCKKRAGRVYSVAETLKWKNDPTLLGSPSTYSPLIERGRWNCRHSIKYISEALAFKLRPELRKNKGVAKLMRDAKESGPEIDRLGMRLADQNRGVVTDINFKSEKSILRKANDDYNGNIWALNDSVRNTVIVPPEKMESVYNALLNEKKLYGIKVQEADKYMGYSGILSNIETANGVIGEVQVNTARMIYAKEPPAIAKSILGESNWNKINKATGLDGGLGHEYYEAWRVLDKKNPLDRIKMEKLEALSREYYSHFREFEGINLRK